MIESTTVLVLGAGASAPYHFPTGAQLVQKICETPISDEEDMFQETSGRLAAFRSALKRSRVTIDEFLEDKPQWRAVGKRMIAYFIMWCEDAATFDRTEPDFTADFWYDELLKSLDYTSLDALRQNKLTVVSFNYDRSFEQYLYQTTQAYHFESDEAVVAEAVRSIPIIHVHGSIGFLPWQNQALFSWKANHTSFDPSHVREYKIDRDPDSVDRASQSIIIVGECRHDTKPFADARQCLREAERVFFLGFAYHPTSMERLRCPKNGNVVRSVAPGYRQTVIGTAFGLKDKNRQDVGRLGIQLWNGDVRIHEFLMKCDSFYDHSKRKTYHISIQRPLNDGELPVLVGDLWLQYPMLHQEDFGRTTNEVTVGEVQEIVKDIVSHNLATGKIRDYEWHLESVK